MVCLNAALNLICFIAAPVLAKDLPLAAIAGVRRRLLVAMANMPVAETLNVLGADDMPNLGQHTMMILDHDAGRCDLCHHQSPF